MINLVLCGSGGKMGQAVCSMIEHYDNIKIIAGISKQKNKNFETYRTIFEIPKKPDVVLDFSNTTALSELLSYCIHYKIPLVICTTGYYGSDLEKIEKAAKKIPILRSGNMSVGVNLMLDLLKTSRQVLDQSYDIEIIEKHHRQKIDAPSGTALMLADTLKENKHMPYIYDRTNKFQSRPMDEIGISSIRGGTIVGEHTVIFAGHDEVIEITHRALSREIFAKGALDAAIFLSQCTEAKLYTMTDLLNNKKNRP